MGTPSEAMAVDDKIQKLRTLAERGATEGERAAARAALERVEARMRAEAPPAKPQGFHDLMAGVGVVSLTDEEIDRIVNEAFSAAGMQQSRAKHHHGRVWFDGS